MATLLPLNVPADKPLLYCNVTGVAQTHVQLDENVYSCANQSIAISCPRTVENATTDVCTNTTMECDLKTGELETYYCTNATLLSRASLVCNSTTILNGTNVNETTTILNCYRGSLPVKLASFIPTTTTTEAPITTTTEKQLSLGARIHIFFVKLVGNGHILDTTTSAPTTTTALPIDDDDPRLQLSGNQTPWVPEALTIPPETTTATATTTTTTETPFIFGRISVKQLENGSFIDEIKPVEDDKQDVFRMMWGKSEVLPPFVVKIPITTEAPKNVTESDKDSNSTTFANVDI